MMDEQSPPGEEAYFRRPPLFELGAMAMGAEIGGGRVMGAIPAPIECASESDGEHRLSDGAARSATRWF